MTQKLHSNSEDDLDLIALDTAIALERYLDGEQLDSKKVELLLSRLGQTPGLVPNSARAGALPNPSTVAIYHRAMRDLLPTPVNTIDELREAMMTLVNSNCIADLSLERAGRLRDFCCRLHDELISISHLPRRLPDNEDLTHRAA